MVGSLPCGDYFISFASWVPPLGTDRIVALPPSGHLLGEGTVRQMAVPTGSARLAVSDGTGE